MDSRFKKASVSGASLSIGRQRVGAFLRMRASKNAFKHSLAVKCGKPLACSLKTLTSLISGSRPFWSSFPIDY